MRWLCLETSSSHLSLALFDGTEYVAGAELNPGRRLSDELGPAIEKILKENGWTLSSPLGYLVGLGPGSFTGLRVGLAMLKGLALVKHSSVIGVSSLDAMAAAVKGEAERILCLSDARRGMVYSARYSQNESGMVRTSEYALSPLTDVVKTIDSDHLVTGDGVGTYRVELEEFQKRTGLLTFSGESLWRPRARFLMEAAQPRIETADLDDLHTLKPLYLYPADCQVSRAQS